MTCYEEMKEFVDAEIKIKGKNYVMTGSEIRRKMRKMYPHRRSDARPADFCYNKINKGLSPTSMLQNKLFEWDNEKKEYIFRGENFKYRGDVFGKYGGKQNVVVGNISNNGELILEIFYRKYIK